MAFDQTAQTKKSEAYTKAGSNRYTVQVSYRHIHQIKDYCQKNNLPLIEEYDFNQDNTSPNLQIDLKTTTTVRDYQEASLSKMFSRGRARSGIIVLPCGAGKTLTGIAAASHIKKSTLVLCSSNTAVAQWFNEFYRWANLYD